MGRGLYLASLFSSHTERTDMPDITITLNLKDEDPAVRKRLVSSFLNGLSETMTEFDMGNDSSEPLYALEVRAGKEFFYGTNAIYHGDERECLLDEDGNIEFE